MEGVLDCYECKGYPTKNIFDNPDVVVVVLHIVSEQAKPDLLIHTSGYFGGLCNTGRIGYELKSQETESYCIRCSFYTNLIESDII